MREQHLAGLGVVRTTTLEITATRDADDDGRLPGAAGDRGLERNRTPQFASGGTVDYGTTINNLEVIALRDLKKGKQYQLMVGTLISLKNYPLFNFYRKFKTDRYTVNFIY